jgi:antibiotic biosynthesis monooxygenase (ABM) superfamily enzyme
MVVHIVLFNFKEENKEEHIRKAKEMLEALVEKVPTLKEIEVGINFADKERAMDLSIIATFDNKVGLEAYATHPEHIKVVEFLRDVVSESRVVDYVQDR